MIRKTYDYYTVRYQSVGQKWMFQWPGNRTLFVACKGQQVALGVAKIIAGALKRNDNQLDNLARKNIDQLLARQNSREE